MEQWTRRNVVLFLILLAQGLDPWYAFVPRSIQTGWRRFIKDELFRFSPFDKEQLQSWTTANFMSTTTSSTNNNDKKYKPISSEQIEQLKESVDIVAVIESYDLPQFTRKGNNGAVCICPFHNDKNPSLHVDSTRQIYKCFSCGAQGDAIGFVRNYSELQENQEMSFFQALNKLNDEKFMIPGYSPLQLQDISQTSSFYSPEQRQAIAHEKERIGMANSAAAAFYCSCFLSNSAGAARSHLQLRGLDGSTARAFAIGYAPNVYFQDYKTWNEGSLVHHLRDNGFTAKEIVDAGLATRTRRGKAPSNRQMKTSNTKTTNVTESETSDESIDFSTLMDRFRNRLVIPIFDATGEKVLGFGGRILDENSPIHQNSNFKAPKYLNSPESKLFHKKMILFGYHLAKRALERAISGKISPNPLVLVEGYMDAITLWQAGVREVVASMGTGITREQLSAAAKLAVKGGKHVILCLDNDEAGTMAIERLCSSELLSSVSVQYVVEFRVASLPDGVKDPAEFIEGRAHNEQTPEDEFRKQVIQGSVEWSDWYLQRIMSSYDSSALRGGVGSFGDIFDRMSSFLATFTNAADRTKRACDAARFLADKLANESGGSDGVASSETVRMQLESDLVAKVSKLVRAKEAIVQRIESAPDGGGSDATIQAKLASMSRGLGSLGEDESNKLSRKVIQQMGKAPSPTLKEKRQGRPSNRRAPRSLTEATPPQGQRRRSFRQVKRVSEEKALAPHFAGFRFELEADAAWMGQKKRRGNNNEMLLVKKNKGSDAINDLGQTNAVYFNSNEYHGGKSLTPEAMRAGYNANHPIARDPKLFEKGVGSLLKVDPNRITSSGEDDLLRILVLFGSARRTMKASMELSKDVSSTAHAAIEWSTPDKAWLFSCLVDHVDDIPSEISGSRQQSALRSYLAQRDDAPPNAFCQYYGSEGLHGVGEESSDSDETSSVSKTSDYGQGLVIDVNADDAHSMSNGNFGPLPPGGEEQSQPYQEETLEPLLMENKTEIIDQLRNEELSQRNRATADLEPSHPTTFGSISVSMEGTLDRYFSKDQDIFATASDSLMTAEERASLAVQDLHAKLLWSASMSRLSGLQDDLRRASKLLLAKSKDNEEDGGKPLTLDSKDDSLSIASDDDSLSVQDLTVYCTNLTAQIRDAVIQTQDLAASSEAMSGRLVSIAKKASASVCRLITKPEYDELCEKLDKHLMEVNQVSDMDFEHESQTDSMAYEEVLSDAEVEWGELYSDDQMWGPTSSRRSEISNPLDEEISSTDRHDEETLEAATARINRDWADWLDDDDDDELIIDDTEWFTAGEVDTKEVMDWLQNDEKPNTDTSTESIPASYAEWEATLDSRSSYEQDQGNATIP